MLGFSVIRKRKLDSIIDSASRLSVDNLTLGKRISEAKTWAEWASRKHDYIDSTNRTPARKSEEFQKILKRLITELKNI